MTTTTLKGHLEIQGETNPAILKFRRAIGEFRQAVAQTRTDLRRAAKERASQRAFDRDTAQAQAVAASYAQSDPRVAADIRAAIDRHALTK